MELFHLYVTNRKERRVNKKNMEKDKLRGRKHKRKKWKQKNRKIKERKHNMDFYMEGASCPCTWGISWQKILFSLYMHNLVGLRITLLHIRELDIRSSQQSIVVGTIMSNMPFSPFLAFLRCDSVLVQVGFFMH